MYMHNLSFVDTEMTHNILGLVFLNEDNLILMEISLNNLSGLLLADCKWLHPIVIAFNTLCPVQFYIHWCVALH